MIQWGGGGEGGTCPLEPPVALCYNKGRLAVIKDYEIIVIRYSYMVIVSNDSYMTISAIEQNE